MIRCLHCGAETSNGLALCELCQRKALACLEFLPLYFRNLARWRPGRAGSRPVPGSREPVTPGVAADDRVTRALDEAGNALTTWARLLTEARHVEAPDAGGEAEQVEALCSWFAGHLISISTLDWCGEFVRSVYGPGEEADGIGYHEWKLRRLTESVAPGWYAGACARCGEPTYVALGLTWVTCALCGATTSARDHIDIVLAEARGWVARPKPIAETLVALLDGEPSVDRLYARIRKWESLGWLDSSRRLDADGDPVGPKLYRLGEVLDLAMGRTDAPTRPMRMTTA